MRAKKFVCCLLAMLLLAGVSFISCGNSSKAKADSELTTQDGEDLELLHSMRIIIHGYFPV